ncbi:hypothetical protein OIE62_21945 [Streptomyces scopuliridis]|uniref:Uncharacterized protein n=1 Tax=Streptomyces scopuliridis TaxID=452529 RepID=A0ACD4ZL47_9ACTN|nr:hypothetical protein [Streptomyces scopuliridis]WSB34651.1 hypothetical protein OG949_18440 [Streptomyces scopuliridis]WSB98899.1 hypothetical protein OG835_19000 [Streptomyces scopuliridis]WSC07399.1 hypothetical protein OIE62_21945 [Streptomyces scopuliridis]
MPRRARWRRVWGIGSLLGALVLLLAVAGFAASVPEAVGTVRAFRSAHTCTDGGSRTDCFHAKSATVRSTERTGGKNPKYEVRLDGPAGVPDDVDLGADEPLFKRLKPGDEVTVTMWRDYATALSRDGVTQQSGDSPESEPEWQAGLAAVSLTLACYLLYLGVVLLARARKVAEHGPPYGFWFFGMCTLWAAVAVVPAGIAGAFASIGPGHEDRGWLVLVAVWAALLPGVYFGVRWHGRRRRRTARAKRLYGPRPT